MNNLTYLLVSAFIILGGCKKQTQKPLDIGLEYFPIEVSSALVYQVDCTAYNSFFADTQHFKFQEKHVTDHIHVQPNGDSAFIVHVFQKDTASSSLWTYKKDYALYKQSARIERFKDNLRQTVFTFPVKDGYTWDANAFNTDPEVAYYYKDVNAPFENYDSSVYVIQNETINALGDYHAFEVYGKHTGLVYKEQFDVTRATPNGQLTDTLDGFELRKTLLYVE